MQTLNKKKTSKALGQDAETLACQFLKNKGLYLVQKNYQIYGGEIDLIMRDNQFLIFVEVKMRTANKHGDTLEAITPIKRKRIIRTANHYLAKHQLSENIAARFDVIGINAISNDIQWIQNAFDVDY